MHYPIPCRSPCFSGILSSRIPQRLQKGPVRTDGPTRSAPPEARLSGKKPPEGGRGGCPPPFTWVGAPGAPMQPRSALGIAKPQMRAGPDREPQGRTPRGSGIWVGRESLRMRPIIEPRRQKRATPRAPAAGRPTARNRHADIPATPRRARAQRRITRPSSAAGGGVSETTR